MLLVFLIVHVNMLFPSNSLGISAWVLWLRLPISIFINLWGIYKYPQASFIDKSQFIRYYMPVKNTVFTKAEVFKLYGLSPVSSLELNISF